MHNIEAFFVGSRVPGVNNLRVALAAKPWSNNEIRQCHVLWGTDKRRFERGRSNARGLSKGPFAAFF